MVKIKRRLFLFFLSSFCLLVFGGFGQLFERKFDECLLMKDSLEIARIHYKYGIDKYIPKPNDSIIYIGFNIHIFQNDTGGENFANNMHDVAQLNKVVERVNSFYLHNIRPSDPIAGVVDLPSTFLQFKLNKIYFHRSTKLMLSSSTVLIEQYLKRHCRQSLSCVNLVFTNASCGSMLGTTTPPDFNMKKNSMTLIFNAFCGGLAKGQLAFSVIIAHEFGHLFDLVHTYLGGNASALCGLSVNDDEYLDDVFGPWPGNCPHLGPDKSHPWDFNTYASVNDRRTNNIMGGFYGGTYFSPKQIGIMHRSLALTNVRKYVLNFKR